MVTVAQLRAADPDALRSVAGRWLALSKQAGIQAEEYQRAARDLPGSWSGDAAAAAVNTIGRTGQRLDAAEAPLKGVESQLHAVAEKLAAAQGRLQLAIARVDMQNDERARRQGGSLVTLNADGTVTVNVEDPQGYWARFKAEVEQEIATALRIATEADNAASAELARLLPSATDPTRPRTGPSRADVENALRGRSPREVKAWWDSLTPDDRRWVVEHHPDLIGNTDGIPVAARDQANRIHLDNEQARLAAEQRRLVAERDRLAGTANDLHAPGPVRNTARMELSKVEAELARVEGALAGLERIEKRLDTAESAEGGNRQRAYLIGLDTAAIHAASPASPDRSGAIADGRAIVSVGNPDEADNVVTFVPGTGADLSKAGGDIERADRMADDANRVDPTRRTAVVMWLGYDAPDEILDAVSSSYAHGGVDALNRFQDGLRATHSGPPSHNTVMGHSYGTTVIGVTMQERGINADDVIFVASPGVDTNHVGDLRGVPADHVWATRADNDMIRRVPDWDIAHGNDPVRADFGARVFGSDPGHPDEEGAVHSRYWDKDNLSRRNFAYIVTGQYDKVR